MPRTQRGDLVDKVFPQFLRVCPAAILRVLVKNSENAFGKYIFLIPVCTLLSLRGLNTAEFGGNDRRSIYTNVVCSVILKYTRIGF